MPVIIRPENYTTWVDTNLTDVIKIQAMSSLTLSGLWKPIPSVAKSTGQKMIHQVIESILD